MGKFKVGDKVRSTCASFGPSVLEAGFVRGFFDEESAVVEYPGWRAGHDGIGGDYRGPSLAQAGHWIPLGDLVLDETDDTWDFDPRKASNDNAFKIEAGKFYRTRDGKKVGPIILHGPGAYGDGTGRLWRSHGTRYFGGETHTDLIAEWIDEPKFKAGDRVRWTSGTVHWQDVTLTEYDGNIWLGVCKKLGEGGFPEDELELLPPASPARTVSQPTHNPHIVAVFINEHPAPNHRPFVHGSAEAATAEAERLASLHPQQEFGVFALVAKRVGEVTVRAA